MSNSMSSSSSSCSSNSSNSSSCSNNNNNNSNNNNKIIVAFKRPKLSVFIIGLVICIVHSILYDFLENKQQKSIFQSIYNYKWDDHNATIEQQNSSFWSASMISASEQFNQFFQFTVDNDDNDDDYDDDDEEEDNFVSENSNNVSYSYPFTVGACLQTKDDNLLLPEWLAYHYTVLPLRYLIVAIDPLSLTTPEPIFEKFRSIGMTIEVWTGNWYFTYRDGRYNFNPYNHTVLDAFRMHQRRQHTFYTKCLQKFHHSIPNISWVMLADSDEYLTYNTILPSEQPKKNKQQTYNNNNIQKDDNDTIAIRRRLPTTIGKQNETIAHYIAYHQSKLEQGTFSFQILKNDSLCTVFPRLNFVAVDITTIEEGKEDDNGNGKTTTSTTGENSIINTTTSTTNASSSSSSSSSSSFRSLPTFDLPPHARRPILPKGGRGRGKFDSSQFHTLRYVFHYKLNGKPLPGKSLVNVRNLNISQPMYVQNPHRPFKDACDNGFAPSVASSLKDKQKGFEYPFRFNHYTGSLETFIARPERTVDQWLDRNNLTEKIKDFNYKDYYINDGTTTTATKKNTIQQQQQHSYDESLMEWLPEFAHLVGGREKAFELTQQFREDALQEWAEIKRMYYLNDEPPPFIFDWD